MSIYLETTVVYCVNPITGTAQYAALVENKAQKRIIAIGYDSDIDVLEAKLLRKGYPLPCKGDPYFEKAVLL